MSAPYRRLGNYEYIPGSGWQRAQGRGLRDFTARSHNRTVAGWFLVLADAHEELRKTQVKAASLKTTIRYVLGKIQRNEPLPERLEAYRNPTPGANK